MERLLAQLDLDTDSIRRVTGYVRTSSNGMLQSPDKFVALWVAELQRRFREGIDPLPLVYSCNDVLQETRQDADDAFAKAFLPTLLTSLKMVVEARPDLKKKISRTLGVWRERGVYPAEELADMAKSMGMFDLAGELEAQVFSDDVYGGGADGDFGGEDGEGGEGEITLEQMEAQKRADIKNVLKAMTLGELAIASRWVHDGEASDVLCDTMQFTSPGGELDQFMTRVMADAIPAHKLPEMNEVIRGRLTKLRAKRAALLSSEFVKTRVIEELNAEENMATTRMEGAANALSMALQMQEAVEGLRTAGYRDEEPIRVQCPTFRATVKHRGGLDLKQREAEIAAQVEAAKKAEEERLKTQPMVYDKVKRIYVPLPSANQEEMWRS
jgi:hypothetical protein